MMNERTVPFGNGDESKVWDGDASEVWEEAENW